MLGMVHLRYATSTSLINVYEYDCTLDSWYYHIHTYVRQSRHYVIALQCWDKKLWFCVCISNRSTQSQARWAGQWRMWWTSHEWKLVKNEEKTAHHVQLIAGRHMLLQKPPPYLLSYNVSMQNTIIVLFIASCSSLPCWLIYISYAMIAICMHTRCASKCWVSLFVPNPIPHLLFTIWWCH